MKQSLRAATALAAFVRRGARRPAPISHGIFKRIYRCGLTVFGTRPEPVRRQARRPSTSQSWSGQ